MCMYMRLCLYVSALKHPNFASLKRLIDKGNAIAILGLNKAIRHRHFITFSIPLICWCSFYLPLLWIYSCSHSLYLFVLLWLGCFLNECARIIRRSIKRCRQTRCAHSRRGMVAKVIEKVVNVMCG